MGIFYEQDFLVDTRDTDPFGQCRPSALLGMLQEAATGASLALGTSREEMIAHYRAFWMLARIWYRLDRPLEWDETMTIKTWHRGGKGAAMYRDFDLCVGGVPIGEAVSVWALADVETHRPMRLSKIPGFVGSDGGALCKDRMLTKLKCPVPLAATERRTIHYSDADVNRHVNNARYADFACDALELQVLGAGKRVSSLQIGYLAESRPGETLALFTGAQDGVYYVHGAAESDRFDAALTLADLPLDNPTRPA